MAYGDDDMEGVEMNEDGDDDVDKDGALEMKLTLQFLPPCNLKSIDTLR